MPHPTRWLRPLAAASAVAPALLVAAVTGVGAAEAPTGQAAEEPTVVAVRSFSYRPDPVQVTAGGQVRWHWEGDGRHSVTAVDRSFDSDPDCEDNVLLRENCRTGGGEDFVWTAPDVSERTEIAYGCKLHGESQGMTGTVVVVPAPAPSPSSEPSESPTPAPSAPESGGEGEGSGGSSEEADDDPPPEQQRGTAPQLGSQTAPGSSPPPVASPEVAAPIGDPALEPFPSPAPIPSASPSDLGEVALDLPDDDGGLLRTVLVTVATVAVTGTAIAFGSLVLFGPRWR